MRWGECLGQCVQCLFKQNLGSSKASAVLNLFCRSKRRCHPFICQSKNSACYFPILWSRKQINVWCAQSECPNQHCETIYYKISHIYTYNTRSSKLQLLSTKYSRLNLQKKAFSRMGVKIWNKILNEFKSLSKFSFKKQIKKSLFQILGNEDTYLDVENITCKFKDCTIKTNWSNSFCT